RVSVEPEAHSTFRVLVNPGRPDGTRRAGKVAAGRRGEVRGGRGGRTRGGTDQRRRSLRRKEAGVRQRPVRGTPAAVTDTVAGGSQPALAPAGAGLSRTARGSRHPRCSHTLWKARITSSMSRSSPSRRRW